MNNNPLIWIWRRIQGVDVIWGDAVCNIGQPVRCRNTLWDERTRGNAGVYSWAVILLDGNNESKIPAWFCSLSNPSISFIWRMLTLTEKKATPDPDPVFVVVSSHRLKFLGTSCEEEDWRLGRVWRGWYYGPLGLGIPVLPSGGPDNSRYNLQRQQEIAQRRRMMTIKCHWILCSTKNKKPPQSPTFDLPRNSLDADGK